MNIITTEAFYIAYFIVAFLMYVLMDKTIYDIKHEMLLVKFFTLVVMALIWPVIIVMMIILIITGPFRRKGKKDEISD